MLKQDETLENAALREVTEESGYSDVDIVHDLGEQLVAFQYEGKQIQRTEYYFLMRTRSEQQLPRPAGRRKSVFPNLGAIGMKLKQHMTSKQSANG